MMSISIVVLLFDGEDNAGERQQRIIVVSAEEGRRVCHGGGLWCGGAAISWECGVEVLRWFLLED